MKNQPGLATRMAAEPSHLEGVDYELTPHVFSPRPAHHLAVEQVNDHGQKQPTLSSPSPCSIESLSKGYALRGQGQSIDFQRTANSVLTVCVSQGDNPNPMIC